MNIRKFKSFVFGLAFFGAMGFGEIAASAQEEACEPSIQENGPIIIVTVCNRKTSFLGGLVGIECGARLQVHAVLQMLTK